MTRHPPSGLHRVTGTLDCVPRSTYLCSLREQVHSRGRATARLVIACHEPLATKAFTDDLRLTVKGLRLSESALCEALDFAISDARVDELIVVSTTSCPHLPEDDGTAKAASPATDRLTAGLRRHLAGVESAKVQVARAVHILHALAAALAPGHAVPVGGLLWSEAANVFYHYDLDRRGFHLVPWTGHASPAGLLQ